MCITILIRIQNLSLKAYGKSPKVLPKHGGGQLTTVGLKSQPKNSLYVNMIKFIQLFNTSNLVRFLQDKWICRSYHLGNFNVKGDYQMEERIMTQHSPKEKRRQY
jgi:glycyl-tRNA synthetase alpha subunit